MQDTLNNFAPTTSTLFSPSPELHPWDRGIAVAEMQELLCVHGFTVRIDGDFGWRTEVAVKRFQKHHGLRIDGVVDARTWRVLKNRVKLGDRLLWQGKSGADVMKLQSLLQMHGYTVRQTGLFDAETKRSVMDFQQRHDLTSNGVVGATTCLLLQP